MILKNLVLEFKSLYGPTQIDGFINSIRYALSYPLDEQL